MLFGVHNTDLVGPLKQFQTTEFEKEDFRKLVSLINAKLGDNGLDTKTLDLVFEKWWPELEAEASKIIEEVDEGEEEPIRSERDLLEEVLELSRMTARAARGPSHINPKAIQVLLTRFIVLHNQQAAGEGGYQDTLNGLEKMKDAIMHIARQPYGVNSRIGPLIKKVEELSFQQVEKEAKHEAQEDEVPF